MGVFINGWRSSGAVQPRIRKDVTVPAVLSVLTVRDAKKYLRVDHDDEDDEVERDIRIATAKVEKDTGIYLLTQTIEAVLDQFPSGGVLDPLVVPIQSVTSIAYVDSDDDAQTIDAADYLLQSNVIGLADDVTWPTDLRTFDPIVVTVVAGYTDPELIPADLVEAVRMVLRWVWERREPNAMETALYESLVNNYKRLLVA